MARRRRKNITEDEMQKKVNTFVETVFSTVIVTMATARERAFSRSEVAYMNRKKKKWRDEARMYLLDFFNIVP